jgi:predicted metal-dependent peptidase
MHLLLDHHNRRGARDLHMWNIAGDVLINEMLKDHFNENNISNEYISKYVTCTSINLDIDHNSVTTEQVYDKLAAEAATYVDKVNKSQKSNSKNKSSGLNDSNDIVDFEPGEEPKGDNIRDKSEDTPKDGKEWAEAGLEAATRSRMAGNCPKFMERQIDKLINPEVAWYNVLAYYLRQKFCMNSKNRYTFTPPNRRYLYQDIILTSRTGAKKPSIAFSIDTSGSMSRNDITKGVSEMDAIRKLYKVPVYLMEADYNVNRAKWVRHDEPIPSLIGGGGTSFVPVMDHLKENKPDVDVLVYFTDGYGDFGDDPKFDVLWVMNSDVVAPYGKTIRINN